MAAATNVIHCCHVLRLLRERRTPLNSPLVGANPNLSSGIASTGRHKFAPIASPCRYNTL